MSRGGMGRRRRRRRSGGASTGDPLELFLDAITNALGAVMFILMMVLIFRPDGPATERQEDPSEVSRLREEIEAERKRLDADRPRGDPALRARHDAAMQRFLRSTDEVTELKSRLKDVESRSAAAALSARQKERDVTALESKAPIPSGGAEAGSGFIRLGVFREVKGRSIVLLLDAGRVSRKDGLTKDSVVPPPGPAAGTIPVGSPAAARAALERLVAAGRTGDERVDLVVWPGSYRSAALLLHAMRDMGLRWNTILQPGREPVRQGVSGEQN